MKTIRLLFVIVLAAVLLEGGWKIVGAAELDFGSATNKAGRQRMLTQRITKAYLQIGMGANPAQAQTQLMQSVDLFDASHLELKKFAPTTELTEALSKVEALWIPFKDTVLAEPDKNVARGLWFVDEELLDACETVVYLIQDISDQEIARLINTAGRQRMLSQQLAKYYMLLASDLGSPSILAQMDRARNEFKGALATLREAPNNGVIINEKLEDVAQQWVWLESSLMLQTDVYYPLIVADASEKILQLMDTVTALYERLVAPR